jgi:hypothetical protein
MNHAVSEVDVVTNTHALAQLLLSLASTPLSPRISVEVLNTSTFGKSSLTEGRSRLDVETLRIDLPWLEVVRRLTEKTG